MSATKSLDWELELKKLDENELEALDRELDKDILTWIDKEEIKTESGKLIDFESHRFLEAIYDDNSPFIMSMKAAQIGFTTYEILKSLHEAKHEEACDIIYVLPTSDDVNQFSGGKTNRMIDNNLCLQKWTADKDSIEQKRVGKNTIYYRGSWTERTALMITAKKLIVDELDRCKPEIVEQYDSRLQHTTNPRKAFFSNPTIPDFGIDKYWKLSDQKKWHVNHSCGRKYVLDENCIDYDQKLFICPHCKTEITDEQRRMGEWIATSKGVWSGYWIPLWINPMFSAAHIAKYKMEKTPEYFANFVAGLPYVGSGNKVSAQTIINCLSPKVNDQSGRNIIGVDTGKPNWYVVANKKGFFYYGKTSDPFTTGKDPYSELETLLSRWPSSIMVIDAGGDQNPQPLLAQKYPGRVYLAWFRGDRKAMDIFDWGKGTEYGKLLIDRNRAIQWTIDRLLEKRYTFNGTESDWHEYITHWLNIYREWQVDDNGQIDKQKGFKWARTGDDHLVMATVLAVAGLDKFGEQMAQIVGDSLLDSIPVGTMGNETMKEWDALNEYNKKWFQ